jgi:hypothetical protein
MRTMRGKSTKMRLGVKMVCCGCHQAPAAAVGTPDNRTRQVVSRIPASFTGTRPTWTDLAVASMSEVRCTGKISEMPAAPRDRGRAGRCRGHPPRARRPGSRPRLHRARSTFREPIVVG